MTKTEKLAMDVQKVLGEEFLCKPIEERKNNLTLHGISISKGESENAVIVCPNFRDDATNEELINSVIECFNSSSRVLDDYADMAQKLVDWDFVKDKIYLRIVGDKEYAEKYVFWAVENLYAIPYVRINPEITLNLEEEHLESYSVTKDDVWNRAVSNMEGKARLIDMAEFELGILIDLFKNPDAYDPEKITLYTLTVEFEDNFDAGYMLLDSVHQKLQELFPAGYYIIPSSVSEAIVVPKCVDIELALEAISSTNDDMLGSDMVMPNNAYIYEDGTLKLVA